MLCVNRSLGDKLLIDRDQFLGLIEGDATLAKELFELYRADWPKLMAEVDEALNAGDSDRLMELTHRIKGSVRNFFATEVGDELQKVEDLSREGELNGLPEMIAQIRPKLQLIQLELEEICNELA